MIKGSPSEGQTGHPERQAKGAGRRPIALVVDQNAVRLRSFSDLIETYGLTVIGAGDTAVAIEALRGTAPAIVVLDFQFPALEIRRLLRQLRVIGVPEVPVVAVATEADLLRAREAVRGNVPRVLGRAETPEELRLAIEAVLPVGVRGAAPRASDRWERERAGFFGHYEHLFRGSDKMQRLERVVMRVADTSATVLVQGETGVGKELVAKALHYLSARASCPWLKVNCASLPADLLESELFGHERGAFTGAAIRKPGRFELASGGTLLLDEIGEMPLALQSKILHAVQDGEFYRVGGRDVVRVDVRLVAATNKNLQALVAAGSFREDLYYRLNVVNIVVPPLRERREEILPLVEHFRTQFTAKYNRLTSALAPETLGLLTSYSWPGNVRELENIIKRYVVLGDEQQLCEELRDRDRLLQGTEVTKPRADRVGAGEELSAGPGAGLREIGRRAAEVAEQAAIQRVLDEVRWNRAEAARRLRVSYKTLLAKLDRRGFERKPRLRRNG